MNLDSSTLLLTSFLFFNDIVFATYSLWYIFLKMRSLTSEIGICKCVSTNSSVLFNLPSRFESFASIPNTIQSRSKSSNGKSIFNSIQYYNSSNISYA
jgi:hypothetical protein